MEKKRLFFACWPDAAVREQIVQQSQDIIIPNGRRIQPDNLHLTLTFLGDINVDLAQQYAAQAQTIAAAPFSITLQSYGHFSKPKVFYMAVPEIPAGLTQLVNKLNQALAKCGYQAEQRAYCPHVSLFRKAIAMPSVEKQTEIKWHIDRFYLVESLLGAGHAIYKPIEEYKLT